MNSVFSLYTGGAKATTETQRRQRVMCIQGIEPSLTPSKEKHTQTHTQKNPTKKQKPSCWGAGSWEDKVESQVGVRWWEVLNARQEFRHYPQDGGENPRFRTGRVKISLEGWITVAVGGEKSEANSSENITLCTYKLNKTWVGAITVETKGQK